MKPLKLFFYAVFSVAMAVFFVHQVIASERGAKSLFYDPYSGGAVQVGEFKPSVTKTGPDGNPVNPISNYYDNLNPGILYWIELVQPGSGNVKRVSNDRVFRSGDRIRIHIIPNSDGYLNILHKGSTGAMQLIPVSKTENGMVKMGMDYVIPSDGGWLRFDQNPGKESLQLVFASIKSSEEVLNAAKAAATQITPAIPEQILTIYDKYKGSKNLVTEVESGSKDLIVESPSAQPPVQDQFQGMKSQTIVASPFNITGSPNFKVDAAIYDAPANYVVNRSSGSVKEPVVIEITLNHHP